MYCSLTLARSFYCSANWHSTFTNSAALPKARWENQSFREPVLQITALTYRCACKLRFCNGSSYGNQEKIYWIWQPHNFIHTSGSTWGMRYSAVSHSDHYWIAFHHLHLNVLIAVECLLCFQAVLGNAILSQYSCQHRVLMRTLLVSHIYKFVTSLQCICNLIKLRNHHKVKKLKTHFTLAFLK